MLIWFKGYNYDLVSGNVNSVSYNKGKRDEFRHRYFYDADNRLTLAETSTDGWNYTLDAKYFYYLHGPLARTELGDYNQKVQGLDYAYTLHGWLKSVNGASLNHERDMGKDGHYTLPNNANAKFGRDAFGFMLHYYDGDYTPVGGLSSNFVPNFAGSNILSFKNDLFNGNIPFMQTSLPDVNAYNTNGAVVNSSLGNLYQYDQLNRLVEHRVFDNFNIATNNWLNTPLNNGTDKFYENFTYDANGNILNINRNGANTGTGLSMDNFTYRYNNNVSQVIYPSSSSTGYCTYPMQSNKLYHVNDVVAASNYTDDVDDQGSFTPTQNTINTANNYGYDEIGNLVRDNAENIQEITWNVYGKIESISRTGSNNKPNLAFTYDAAGQRISKTVMPRNNGVLSTEKDWTTTYYVRDATGNVMATYSQTYTDLQSNQIKEEIKLKELHLYGSSRLGIVNANRVMATQDYYIPSYNTSNGTFVNPSVMFNTLVTTEVSPLPTIFTVYKGNKQYEISNHLGNVLATISDRRVPRDDNGDLLIDYFNADILSTSDYYAFGSAISSRAIGNYRYGFNTQEKDDEIAGEGNSYTAEFWQYDSRLGRRFNVDPVDQVSVSNFAVFVNSPIYLTDPNGDCPTCPKNSSEGEVHSTNDGTAFNAPDGRLLSGTDGTGLSSFTSTPLKGVTWVNGGAAGWLALGFETKSGDRYTWDNEKRWYINSNGREFDDHLTLDIANSGLNIVRPATQMFFDNTDYGDALHSFKKSYYEHGSSITNMVFDGFKQMGSDIAAGGNRRSHALLTFGMGVLATGPSINPSGSMISRMPNIITNNDGYLFGISFDITLKNNLNVQRFGLMNFTGIDYWGLQTGSSVAGARIGNAILKRWNNLSLYTTGAIPAGTTIRIGITGPQNWLNIGLFPQIQVASKKVINQSSKYRMGGLGF